MTDNISENIVIIFVEIVINAGDQHEVEILAVLLVG